MVDTTQQTPAQNAIFQVAAPVVGATEELLTAEALRGMLTSLKVPAPLT